MIHLGQEKAQTIPTGIQALLNESNIVSSQ
jgi:hypothetical protein